ncbi:hypothetical protein DQR70_05900 [Salmonella enterica subsp. enterica serovar Oslo]|nr:hypothetical protein [Salmonella enterica subsp. enterica serovar Oslo]
MGIALVVDLKRLVMYGELFMERFARDYPDYADRVSFDRSRKEALRDYIYNRFWNLLGETAKYDMDELEEDLYLDRLFKGWKPDCWYHDSNKELIVDDMGSFRFNADVVEELDDKLQVIISKERLYLGYSILEMDISRIALTLDIYGDWRAQQWCIENDEEYIPT